MARQNVEDSPYLFGNVHYGFTSVEEFMKLNTIESPLMSVCVTTNEPKNEQTCEEVNKNVSKSPIKKKLALILNFANYIKKSDIRIGAKYDSIHMTLLFTQLGYTVIQCDENMIYTKKNVTDILDNFIETCTSEEVSSLAVFIGGHGKENIVGLPNEEEMYLSTDIVLKFNAIKNTTSKLFFVQACRSSEQINNSTEYDSMANAIIIFSSSSGNHSFRCEGSGSPFVMFLVDEIMKNAWKDTLIELLKRANEEMKDKPIEYEGETYTLGITWIPLEWPDEFSFDI